MKVGRIALGILAIFACALAQADEVRLFIAAGSGLADKSVERHPGRQRLALPGEEHLDLLPRGQRDQPGRVQHPAGLSVLRVGPREFVEL